MKPQKCLRNSSPPSRTTAIIPKAVHHILMCLLFFIMDSFCPVARCEVDQCREEVLHHLITDEADRCNGDDCCEIESDLDEVGILAKMCHAESADGDG